jgi:hypothetical protein
VFGECLHDFVFRKRRDFEIHEPVDAAHAVAQFVVNRMIDACPLSEPRGDAERAKPQPKDKEIPRRQPEADGPLFQALSSSRSA